MPAKRQPSAKPATSPAAPAEEPQPPAEAETSSEAETDTDSSAEAVPMNRAERRARERGKSGQAPQPASRGKVVGSHGPAHTQRNWANRRSG